MQAGTAHALEGGFANPAIEAATAFRAIMEAMARPGTIHDVKGALPPAPLSISAGVTVLTLCDADTPVHLAGPIDCEAVRAWISFHTGAPFVEPSQCVFAVGTWPALQPISAFSIGTSEYPDRSATLIVECSELKQAGAILRGPGIRDVARISLPDIVPFQKNNALFPLGLDFFLCCGAQVAALPRSVEVL